MATASGVNPLSFFISIYAPASNNILVDEKLETKVSYVPMGHIREIDVVFGLENPYAG